MKQQVHWATVTHIYYVKLPDYIRVGNGDDITENTSSDNLHDGNGEYYGSVYAIRIVCQNTLNASLRNI